MRPISISRRKLLAGTAAAGNMPLEVTLPNALRLIEIAGRSDIPVAAGASRPLRRRQVSAPHIHGRNGLGDVDFPVAMEESHIRVLEAADTAWARAAGRLMRAMLARARPQGSKDTHMLVHDAMAVAAFIDPSLCTLEPMHIEVETQGELTAGETVGYRHAPIKGSAPLADAPARPELGFAPNADAAVDVDAARAVSFLVERLARPQHRS